MESDLAMTSDLDRLARAHGVSLTRPSPENVEVPITDSAKTKVLAALGVAVDGDTPRPARLKKKHATREAIPQSYLPAFLEEESVWGISLQLYELRSERNWGIGDFEDLLEMIRLAGSLGADLVGLNPLHAPFLADPDRCSPYEPSNRQMLNPLYIAVDRVAGFTSSADLDVQLQDLRQTDLVDYVRVARLKIAVLHDLWQHWSAAPRASRDGGGEFEAFVQDGGEILRRHALFEVLSAFMAEQGRGTGWKSWPVAYQKPENSEVVAFADEHGDSVEFHMWLQWIAHQQLSRAAELARERGMRIGLYLDLAVGEAMDGSATWSEQDAYVADATVGSPPDPFATEGQDWHLAGFHPSAIAASKDPPFQRMVKAAMRYAGAIRIDHAAALRRLFLVPLDSNPAGGAYVDYPQNDLLRILSEVSNEHRCLVIGEDLGMLPEGLQDDLSDARILSYRILTYEREEHRFKPASAYPRLSLACISTHDHQTLAGWWRGADIKARERHGIVPPDVTQTHIEERKDERRELKDALEAEAADPPSRLPSATATDAVLKDLVVSAHRFIARTSSALVAVRLADLTGEKRPTNIPGTSDSYPNWKPRLSVSVERLREVPVLLEITKAVQFERRADGKG